MKKKNQKSPLSTSQHPLRNPSLTLGFPSLCQQQIPATSHCQECFLQNLTIPTLPIQSQSIYSPTLSSPPAMSKHATLRTLLLSTGNSKVPITQRHLSTGRSVSTRTVLSAGDKKRSLGDWAKTRAPFFPPGMSHASGNSGAACVVT